MEKRKRYGCYKIKTAIFSIMDFLKQLASVEEVAAELENVEKEESALERFILYNLTGDQEYYDISTETDTVKACAVEYNRIASDLRSLRQSVSGRNMLRNSLLDRSDERN